MNQIIPDKTPTDFSPITLGDKLANFESNGLIFTETTHKASQKLPRHYHEHANIAFILSGSFTEILDRRQFDCGPHSVIIKPPGEAHANQYNQRGIHCFLIEVKNERMDSLSSLSQVFRQVTHTRRDTLSMLAARIYRESRIMDSATAISIEGLSLEFIAELSRHAPTRPEQRVPPWLKQAKEILHEHFADAIGLSSLAQHVGVHPVHLAREFRKHYGCPPGEYMRRRRIEFACQKLKSSKLPLVEIALSAGFSDQSHFSRLFKLHVGITPSDFRSIHSRR